MSKVSCDEMSNIDMIVEFLCPQLEVTKEDKEPFLQTKWPETNSFGIWYGEIRSNKMVVTWPSSLWRKNVKLLS